MNTPEASKLKVGEVYVSIIKTQADIHDMLLTAVDYGRYEWFVSRQYLHGKDGYPMEENGLNTHPYNQPLMVVTAWDGEHEDATNAVTKHISIKDAVEALQKLFVEHPSIHQKLVTGFYDLNDADCLMQVIFYGKVVYG